MRFSWTRISYSFGLPTRGIAVDDGRRVLFTRAACVALKRYDFVTDLFEKIRSFGKQTTSSRTTAQSIRRWYRSCCADHASSRKRETKKKKKQKISQRWQICIPVRLSAHANAFFTECRGQNFPPTAAKNNDT